MYRVTTEETVFGVIVKDFKTLADALKFVEVCAINGVICTLDPMPIP